MPPDQPSLNSPDVAPTVRVQGEAAVRAEPDEAILWVTLDALEDSPGKALADVAARSEALVALLDELTIPRADRSTTGITVGEDFDHTPAGRRSLGHRAVASVQVRLTDSETIGQLISRASEQLAARIAGPRWFISPTNPIRLVAASRAAANARHKAAAYASGVDAKLGRLLSMSEPGTSPTVHRMQRHSGGMIELASRAGGDMPIEAGEFEVVAEIDATFELHPK
jgi:uncharacterized protein YggE